MTADLVLSVVGNRVALGPLRRELLPEYHRWRNDFWIKRSYGLEMKPETADATTEWFESQSGGAAVWFTIYERESGAPIGLADLFNVEPDHGVCWFGMLIGNEEHRGRGYGTEATQLMLDVAFTAMNMHSVLLTVDAFNPAGIGAYRRAGFVEIGPWRGATLLAGERYDRILMAAHADTFQSPALGPVLRP